MLLLIYRNLITSLPAGRKSATFCHDPRMGERNDCAMTTTPGAATPVLHILWDVAAFLLIGERRYATRRNIMANKGFKKYLWRKTLKEIAVEIGNVRVHDVDAASSDRKAAENLKRAALGRFAYGLREEGDSFMHDIYKDVLCEIDFNGEAHGWLWWADFISQYTGQALSEEERRYFRRYLFSQGLLRLDEFLCGQRKTIW